MLRGRDSLNRLLYGFMITAQWLCGQRLRVTFYRSNILRQKPLKSTRSMSCGAIILSPFYLRSACMLESLAMTIRQHSTLDRLVESAETALKTLCASPQAKRPSPEPNADPSQLSENERRLSASLMRVNHTGEVCAQALYQGQALTAKLPKVREEMEQAAEEEIDHLAWCENRIKELDSRTSVLNPAFYALSFGMGAAAGLIGDNVSLGFVAATEDQVCKHLKDHQQRLPMSDTKSRAVVDQMLIDEEKHGHAALEAGGLEFPQGIKTLMTLVSKVMTETTSRI